MLLSVNPGLTQDQVRDIIESTCTKVGGYGYSTVTGRTNGTWNNEVGYGCVNAFAAVMRALGAPITGPSIVCTTSATFSITPPAAFNSIVWTCGPNLSISSGQNTASCNLVVTGNGSSWVEASVSSTACGTVTLPRKTVWVGTPQNTKVSAIVRMGPSPNQLCMNTEMAILAGHSETALQGVTQFIWDFGDWAPYFQYYDISPGPQNAAPVFNLSAGAPSSQLIRIYALNSCGYNTQYYSRMFYAVNCGGYLMSVSPNPATDEATIELVSAAEEKAADSPEWELSVFSPGQSLKTKTTKLKDKTYKLNTQGWMDGVYIVRATVGKEIITEKLVVKH